MWFPGVDQHGNNVSVLVSLMHKSVRRCLREPTEYAVFELDKICAGLTDHAKQKATTTFFTNRMALLLAEDVSPYEMPTIRAALTEISLYKCFQLSNPATARDHLKAYIELVLYAYKGRITSWASAGRALADCPPEVDVEVFKLSYPVISRYWAEDQRKGCEMCLVLRTFFADKLWKGDKEKRMMDWREAHRVTTMSKFWHAHESNLRTDLSTARMIELPQEDYNVKEGILPDYVYDKHVVVRGTLKKNKSMEFFVRHGAFINNMDPLLAADKWYMAAKQIYDKQTDDNRGGMAKKRVVPSRGVLGAEGSGRKTKRTVHSNNDQALRVLPLLRLEFDMAKYCQSFQPTPRDDSPERPPSVAPSDCSQKSRSPSPSDSQKSRSLSPSDSQKSRSPSPRRNSRRPRLVSSSSESSSSEADESKEILLVRHVTNKKPVFLYNGRILKELTDDEVSQLAKNRTLDALELDKFKEAFGLESLDAKIVQLPFHVVRWRACNLCRKVDPDKKLCSLWEESNTQVKEWQTQYLSMAVHLPPSDYSPLCPDRKRVGVSLRDYNMPLGYDLVKDYFVISIYHYLFNSTDVNDANMLVTDDGLVSIDGGGIGKHSREWFTGLSNKMLAEAETLIDPANGKTLLQSVMESTYRRATELYPQMKERLSTETMAVVTEQMAHFFGPPQDRKSLAARRL